jgi:formyltetrahydrofolate deformylase
MSKPSQKIQIVTWCSPDKVGLLSEITSVIAKFGGNLLEVIQFTDQKETKFFLRAEIDLEEVLKVNKVKLNKSLMVLAKKHKSEINIRDQNIKPKVGFLVSKEGHCLSDILWRWESGELPIDPEVIISNHPNLENIASHFKVPFIHLEITKKIKEKRFKEIYSKLKSYNVDTIILARFMQILPNWLCDIYKNKIINIHHSFLPSFKGSNPYGQAFNRGVKLIGATSHYVTPELDEGPIIEQEVRRVSHFHTKSDLIRLGKDCEKLALSKAIKLHAESRIFIQREKTIILGD